MTTRVIRDEPSTTVVQDGAGTSGTTIMLMTIVGLVIVAIAVLIILHVTTGVA